MEEKIPTVVSQIYGKVVTSWSKLSGFEDDNYLVTTTNTRAEACEGRPAESDIREKFVLKVSKHASKEYLDIQTGMILHLDSRGITTCVPIASLNGSYINPLPQESGKLYHISVLSYLPGIPLFELKYPLSWLETIGTLLASVDRHLMTFRADNLQVVPTMCSWELRRLPELEPLLDRYCEDIHRDLGEEIVAEYNKVVLPSLGRFRKGYIHGDFCDRNLIVLNHAPGDTLAVTPNFGVIDFGDACLSLYAGDLAIAVADFIVRLREKFDFMDVAKHLITGYQKQVKLNDNERRCMQLLICARLLQVYVLVKKNKDMFPDSNIDVVNRPDWIDTCRQVWACNHEDFMKAVGF